MFIIVCVNTTFNSQTSDHIQFDCIIQANERNPSRTGFIYGVHLISTY